MDRDPGARDPFDLIGAALDARYRVDAVAGEGDYSVVYAGHDLQTDAPVAVKCLRLPPSLDGERVRAYAEAFHAGARLHARLAEASPSIAGVVGAGSAMAPTGMIVPFFVREWLGGTSLAQDLARRRASGQLGRGIPEVVALLAPAFEAAATAQAAGQVHLGLNPRNLFLAEAPGGASLKVLDFGVARAMGELRGQLPGYAAPEQLDPRLGGTVPDDGQPAAVGPWSDVYTLAIVTLELLTDRIVIPGRAAALASQRRPTPRGLGVALPPESRGRARGRRGAPTRGGGPWQRRRAVVGSRGGAPSRARGVGGRCRPAGRPRARCPVRGRRRWAFELAARSAGYRARVPTEPEIPPGPSADDASAAPDRDDLAARGDRRDGDARAAARSPRCRRSRVEAWTRPRTRGRPGVARSVRLAVVVVVVCLVAGLGFTAFLLHLRGATIVASIASASAAPAPPTPPASSTPLAPPPSTAVASVASTTPAPPAPEPAVSDHFPSSAARQALDAVSGEITRCRRGKVWGIGTATVTFANDGTVAHVDVSVPFTGTSTATCVAEAVRTAHVGAFAGKPGVVPYRFFVALK